MLCEGRMPSDRDGKAFENTIAIPLSSSSFSDRSSGCCCVSSAACRPPHEIHRVDAITRDRKTLGENVQRYASFVSLNVGTITTPFAM